MYNVSTKYKTEIKKASRSFECRITIGDKIFTNEDIVDLKLEGNIQPQDGFMLGATTSTTLDLTLINKGNIIYSTNPIKLELGLKIGTEIEYIPMGIYNIDDIVKTDYTIKITAFDNMIKFERAYFSNLEDTATLQKVVNELATKTGVEFIGSLPSYTVKKLEGFTCREILSYVASICGGNATITRDGNFTIIVPKEVDCTISGDNYIDFNREEVKYKVGQITCKNSETIITKGSLGTDSMELSFENPWVTDSIVTDIYNKLKGFEYLGYSLKWQGDLSLDLGDIITCTDVKGVTRKLPILSQKFNYTGGLTAEIGAKGESKNKNSFSSSGSSSNKVDRVVTDLALVNKAFVDYAHINDADIENLKAETAKIQSAEIEIANINTILANFISGESGQFLHLTGQNVIFDEAVIKGLIASEISVADLIAGNIDTNKFNIVSTDGGISIIGATQQFKDKSNQVRLQIGQDAQGNFNFILKGADGTTTLIDHTGIKEGAIADDLIKESMVAENAIGEKQINYNSFITGLNKDDNTQLIKASKVAIDLEGQKLDVAFNSLKTTVNNTKVGGRNYALGTEVPITITGSNTTNQYLSAYKIDCTKVKGKECTVSFDWEVIEGEGKGSIILQTGSNHWQSLSQTINVSPKKGHSTLTVLIEDKDRIFENLQLRADNLIGTVKVQNVKVEIGNKETDWTPAPEDTQNQIDNIEVVGTNLIPNSDFVLDDLNILNKSNYTIEKKAYEGHNVLKLNSISGSNNGVYLGIPSTLDVGKYTLSVSIKLPKDFPTNSKFRIALFSKNGTFHNGSIIGFTGRYTEWTREKVEFNINEKVTDGRIYVQIYDGLGMAECTMLKLEKGSLSEWSAAKEDITEVTNNLQTQISVNNGSIGTLIKDTTIEKDGKAVKLKDDYSTFKQEQDKINLQVSNQQSEFNKSLSIKEQTKINGIELFDQSYVSDLNAKPFISFTNRYSIVPASFLPNGNDSNGNIIRHLDASNTTDTVLFVTEMIPVTNFDNPIYGSLDVLYPGNTNGTVYLQVLFYNKDKQQITENAAVLNCVNNKPMTAIDIWQNFSGFAEIPKDDIRRKSAYMRFRIGVRYNRFAGDAYIRNISVKQLGGANLGGLNTTVTETKALAASMKIEQDNITSKVEDLKTAEIKNRKVGAFRYIRDYLNGNNINTGNHWVELQVLVGSTNIAKGKAVTSNSTITNASVITDGNIESNPYASSSSSESGKWVYVQIDLGEVKNNVDMIKTWHFYQDGRKYNHKLWTSIDGVTWQELYNSDENGQYMESSKGRTYIVNESYTESRLSSAEQKVTASGVITTITEAINNGKNSFKTMQFLLDKDGATIRDGALTIKNKAGSTVFGADTNGNVTLSGNLKAGGSDRIEVSNGCIDFYSGNNMRHSITSYQYPTGNYFDNFINCRSGINGSIEYTNEYRAGERIWGKVATFFMTVTVPGAINTGDAIAVDNYRLSSTLATRFDIYSVGAIHVNSFAGEFTGMCVNFGDGAGWSTLSTLSFRFRAVTPVSRAMTFRACVTVIGGR